MAIGRKPLSGKAVQMLFIRMSDSFIKSIIWMCRFQNHEY